MFQDIFQARIDQFIDGLEEVIVITDDIIDFGKTKDEHDIDFRRLLARCQRLGLKMNQEEIQNQFARS